MKYNDHETSRYYKERVKESTSLYRSMKTGGVCDLFNMAFYPSSRILEIGAGSGRDLNILLEKGFNAFGIDASAAMVAQGVKDYPCLEGKYVHGVVPSEKLFFKGSFEGILCTAVLQHMRDDALFDTGFAIRNNLCEGGRLLISVPLTRNDLDDNERDATGRLHVIRHPQKYILFFERLGFERIGYHESDDGLGRKGIKWASMIFDLRGSGTIRSIDVIESVINRDRKTATYKLALFRALAEIASQEYNSVSWYPDGRIGVSIRRVAEKWLFYYWPIFANKEFIPQINGEKPGSRQPVAFRDPLMKLIKIYGPGGIGNFYSDILKGASSSDTTEMYKLTIKKIESTILRGPVNFAGSSLDGIILFEFNRKDKNISVGSDIWSELSLMWHWIRDALILRWGELTESMSHGEIKASSVIDLLLLRPDVERDTALSREIFSSGNSHECVWSGKPIVRLFDIDHMIPFSLWFNNDLWNLLPAHPAVNKNKKDKLPTRNLLMKRQEVIVYYWKIIEKHSPERFMREIKHIVGNISKKNWELTLFNKVVESVEFTAIQRGVNRWDGYS